MDVVAVRAVRAYFSLLGNSVLPSAFYKCAILGNLILQSRYDSVISGTTVNFTWNSSEDSMEGAEHRRPRWIGPQASGTPEI